MTIENKWQVREKMFHIGAHTIGGFAYFPYQIAFGISLRWLCTGLMFRFYFGPFKFWINP